MAWWRGGVGGLGAVAGWVLSTHVVEKVPDFQDQLTEDRQPATGEQACGIRSLHALPRPSLAPRLRPGWDRGAGHEGGAGRWSPDPRKLGACRQQRSLNPSARSVGEDAEGTFWDLRPPWLSTLWAR